MHTTHRKFIAFFILLAVLLAPFSSVVAATPTVELQFLTVSDWHAQLDPLNVTGVGNVGGAAVLSAYWQTDRAANPNTLTLTAGDSYGASPPLSAFFNEEPAVKAMNMMGFTADTFGNHNFDKGIAFLQNLINLAEFPYVISNLNKIEENLTGTYPFKIFEVAGVKVGVIGIIDPDAPTLVFPGNFGSMTIVDPIAAANKAKAQAKQAGAKVLVALTHMGVEGFDMSTGQPYGDLIEFANNVGGFNLILGDHTDVQYMGIHNNALVVENRSKGLTYARIQMTVDPSNGRIDGRSAEFVTPLSNAVTPDPAILAMLAPYRTTLATVFDTPIGVTTGIFERGNNVERLREVPLGDLVTDSMRWRYGTQLAFTNGGGLRAPLPSSYAPLNTSLRRPAPGYAPGPPYDLVVGDAYAVLPFGNVVVTRNVSGAQLWAILEHSVAIIPGANGRFAQISGFKFVYDSAQPAGSRVVSVTMDDGTPILADATVYSLATNDFTNSGGDGYTMLADGQGTTREVMADVLLEYIRSLGTITPTTSGRITDLARP